jgi:purine-binding chemotaxis protein CheW
VAKTMASRTRSDFAKNLVGFTVGAVRYAIDIGVVSEILNPMTTVALPHAPDVVVGVVEHRGEVVPVVDLRRRFALPPRDADRRTKWVLVRTGSGTVGLVVDSVTEVFGAGEDSKRGVPLLGRGDDLRGISSVHKVGGELVFVIDVEKVAAPAAEIDVAEAAAQLRGEVESS